MIDHNDDFGALLRKHVTYKEPPLNRSAANDNEQRVNPRGVSQKKSSLRKSFQRQTKRSTQLTPEAATTSERKRPLPVDKDSEPESESEPDSDSNDETSTPWSRRGATTVLGAEKPTEPVKIAEESRKRPEFTVIVVKKKKKKRAKAGESTPFTPNRTCKYFLQGHCTNDPCTFFHPEMQPNEIVPVPVTVSLDRGVCRFFKSGSCKNGARCKFSHDLKQELCAFFEAGLCTKGDACPFGHDMTLAGHGKMDTARGATGER